MIIMMKKLICVLLGLCLCAAPLGCGSKSKPDDNHGDDTDKDIYGGERKTLMFEIDEGMGGYEFMSGCKNADGSRNTERMDLILDNVYNGVKDLMGIYNVSMHIYANWYYDADGWDGKNAEAIDRWDPALFYAMDYFKKKGLTVCMEIMSSGVYTNQNGELGRLPLVDINLGTGKEERLVKGIAADPEAIKALKAKYPETFASVRFHELIGTHNGGVSGNPHCYTIDQEDVYTLIDTFAEAGIELVWSDHSWSEMYGINAYWKERVQYAEQKLGDKLTVMWANNAGGYIVDYLNYRLFENFKTDFPNIKLGFSNQNWFMSSYYLLSGPESVTGPAECDMPVELTAGITVAAFMKGASVVQFEPSYQFFNWPRSLYVSTELGQGGDQPGGGVRLLNYKAPQSQIEGDDFDYSPRAELKRLVKILNAKSTQFANVADFYDDNSSRLFGNDVEEAPKTYSQVTVSAEFGNGNRVYYDRYNNAPSKWLNQNEDRYASGVFAGEVIASGRALCQDHAYDETVVVRKENGKNIGYFYNARGCLLGRNTSMFADNTDGEFVGFIAANLIVNRVATVNMDCDEILVARKKDGKINLSIYQASARTVNDYDKSGNFAYQKISSNVDSSIIDQMLGGKSLDAENFLGLTALRSTKTIGKASRMRSTDGIYTVYRTQNGVKLVGKPEKSADLTTVTIETDGAVKAFAAGDTDFDLGMSDELLLAVEKDGQTHIEGWKIGSTAVKTDMRIELGAVSVKSLATYRKAFFLFDSSLE